MKLKRPNNKTSIILLLRGNQSVEVKQFAIKNLVVFAGFAISGFLLWLTLHKSGVEFKLLALNNRQWLFFAGAIFSFVLATWFQSERSKLFWLNDKLIWRDISAYKSLIIGNLYICILPANLGEGIRAWHFSKRNNVTFSRSLGAIFAEKWLDAIGFLIITVILFMIKPFYPHCISYSIAYTAGIILVIAVVYALMRNNKRVEEFFWRIILTLRMPGRFFYRIYLQATQLISNLRRRGLIGQYIFFCAVILSLNGLQFYLLLHCAGVKSPVGGLYSAYLTAVSMMIIAFIPSAPSNVGVLHYGVYSTLILASKQYGIEPDQAALQTYALFGIYLHLSYVIPEVILGAITLFIERKWMFNK